MGACNTGGNERLTPLTGPKIYLPKNHPLINFYKSNVLYAIVDAEEKNGGQPVYYVDIFKAFISYNWKPLPIPIAVYFTLSELFREDRVLADKEMHKFTVNPAF